MPKISPVLVGLVATLTMSGLFTVSTSARATSVDNFAAKMHAYFSEYGVLPILMPKNEEPGDIYLNPYRGFLARRSLCFPQMASEEQGTDLVESTTVQRYSFGGELNATLWKVLEALGTINLRLQDSTVLSFPNATTRYVSQVELNNALQSSLPECKSELEKIGDRQNNYSFKERIPWILQDVILAEKNIELLYLRGAGGSVSANIEKQISEAVGDLGGEITLEVAQAGKLNLAVQKLMPVAYLPAFISHDDVKRLEELDDSTWHQLRQAIFGDEYAETELEAIREKFPEAKIAKPWEMYELMQTGEPVRFDAENEQHLEYIRNQNLLLAASWELYGEIGGSGVAPSHYSQ